VRVKQSNPLPNERKSHGLLLAIYHCFLSHCRSGGGGLRLTRTEEIRFEPDVLFIEFIEHLKNKIKISSYKVYFYLLQIFYIVMV
jgi:hypothetical protein